MSEAEPPGGPRQPGGDDVDTDALVARAIESVLHAVPRADDGPPPEALAKYQPWADTAAPASRTGKRPLQAILDELASRVAAEPDARARVLPGTPPRLAFFERFAPSGGGGEARGGGRRSRRRGAGDGAGAAAAAGMAGAGTVPASPGRSRGRRRGRGGGEGGQGTSTAAAAESDHPGGGDGAARGAGQGGGRRRRRRGRGGGGDGTGGGAATGPAAGG